MRVNSLICALLLCIGLMPAQGAAAAGTGLPSARPEAEGFASERLKRLDAGLRATVDQQHFAGMVVTLARDGKQVFSGTYGYADLAAQRPMRIDTIFRIFSMTKPVTGVAMMILHEQGRWSPTDPIARHIPEFANLKVHAGTDKDGKPILENPVHPPTMAELMSHTAGFTYGIPMGPGPQDPVDAMYLKENVMGSATLQEMIDKLARLPLRYHPGTKWVYSASVDIQGYLVEKLSGKPLPEFMRTEIFEPLGMKDTDFVVPRDKQARLATIYRGDQSGALVAQATGQDPMSGAKTDISLMPAMPSGGGGLYSTAGDYLRFAQMLASEGELDGRRILAPRTIELMRANQLSDALMNGGFGVGLQRMRPGFGFGFDVAVFTDPHRAGSTVGKGSYLWDGAAGTWFWVDPENDIVFVGMIQRLMGGPVNLQELSRTLTYQALIEEDD